MASLDFKKESENFRNYYDSELGLFKAAAESFRTLTNSILAPDFSLQSVTCRVKEREGCIEKFTRKYQSDLEKNNREYEIKDYITDLIGVRVVCLYETDIREIHEVLNHNFDVIDVTDKISIIESTDDQFGYKGLHLDARFNEQRRDLLEYRTYSDFRFEIQIRTIIQDAWSVLDHKIKYKRSIPSSLKRRINRLAALFEIADNEFLNVKAETQKLEEEAKQKATSSTINEREDDNLLDVFNFLTIAHQYFSDYHFKPQSADGFVQEIQFITPNYKTNALQQAIQNNIEKIRDYRDYQENFHQNNLNPYTMIRHALYLSDKDVFGTVLFARQRDNFESWLNGNNS